MNRNHTFIREPIVSGDQEYYSKPNRPCFDDYCRNTKQQVHEKTKSIRNQNRKEKDFRQLEHQSHIIAFHERSPKTEKIHQFEAGFQSTQKSVIIDKNQEEIHNIPILVQEVSNHNSSEEMKPIQDNIIEIHKSLFYENSCIYSSLKDTSTSCENNHPRIDVLKNKEKEEKEHVVITRQIVSQTLELVKSDMISTSETKKVKSQRQIVDPLESHQAHTSLKFITDTMILSPLAASAPVALKASQSMIVVDDDESVAETDSSISSIMKEDTRSNSEILEDDDDDSTILPMSPISQSLLMWIQTAMTLLKFLVWKLPIRILVVTMKMTICMMVLYYCTITFLTDDGNASTCTSSSMSYTHMFNTARVY